MLKMVRRVILICVSIFVLYVILGALIPFMIQPEVEESFKQSFSVSDFKRTSGVPTDEAGVVETAEEALDIRLRMFEEAEKSIVLSTFDIRPGGSCDDIFSSLQEAAGRGVKVRIFVDGLYGMIHMKQDAMFYAAGSNPNIEIRFYNIPNVLMPWTFNGRMHDKYILVDDKLLLLGGRNTFDYFLGSYTDKNLSFDREILINNKAAGTERSGDSVIVDVQSYFEEIWNSEYSKTVYDGKDLNGKKYVHAISDMQNHYEALQSDRPELFSKKTKDGIQLVPVDKATLVTNPTHIYAKQPYVWYELTELMKQAKDRIYIQTPYVAFSKNMYRDFTELSKGPARFDMQINSTAIGDNFMASSDYIFNKKKLLKTGVTIHEFQGEYSTHGKSGLIDSDFSYVGSYNLDMRSTHLDTETVIVIQGEEFNRLLESYIRPMHDESLTVNPEGGYIEKPGVTAKESPGHKKVLFAVSSVVLQLFRYLI